MKFRMLLVLILAAAGFSAPTLLDSPEPNGSTNYSLPPASFASSVNPANPNAIPSATASGNATSSNTAFSSIFGQVSHTSPAQPVTSQATSTYRPNSSPQSVGLSAPVYPAATHLGEIFRFDINPNWVRQRWESVSKLPGEDGLYGLRVPLVTGPRPVDVHGSLTYYFDDTERLQRLTLKGWTGDGRELVALATGQFGLTKQDSTAPGGLYWRRDWGTMKSVLRIDHPPTSREGFPTEQWIVLLELTNPNESYELSQATSEILKAMNSLPKPSQF